MSKNNRIVRVCIKKGNIIYKVTAITLLNDGSFKIDVPYCLYNEALLFKHPVDYSKRESWISTEDFTQTFKSEIRPQLSIHASGFVQFSGKGITSGIDTETGKAKGIGIYSAPLNTPIKTGPTTCCIVWGIEHFKKIDKVSSRDIVFEESSFIKRIYKDKPINSIKNTKFNTYVFEIFVFPKESIGVTHKTTNGEEATVRFFNYYESPGAIFTFLVIRLLNHNSVLGVLPFVSYSTFAEKAVFGFHVGSPSGTETPINKPPVYMIQLMYPNNLLEDSEIDKSILFNST